jgi:hypothetical protein
MVFSRWKVMAGVVGVSMVGLAAIAAQSSKLEPAQEELKVPAIVPVAVVPPAATSVAKPTPEPATPSTSVRPYGDWTPMPAHAPVKPTIKAVDLPILSLADSKPAETKTPEPAKPMAIPVVPSLSTPPVPAAVSPPLPVASPAPFPPPSGFEVPAAGPGTVPIVPAGKLTSPPVAIMPIEPSLPPRSSEAAPTIPPTVAVATTSTVAPAQTKFRIVLRVGEGEPSFEVRHGDDLVMKVACEKVDIKSPEKGQGLSNITATGKVKFVGFGAEGTCDSLSFLAGSGEVALAGNVNVKVRDKIGRVESELNADKMQYKLDQTALTGVLKP